MSSTSKAFPTRISLFRMSSLLIISAALIACGLTSANPVDLHRRAVTQLSTTELASFAPFTQFARAAYCGTDILQDWTCGEACEANADFAVSLVGGDDNDIQNYFVGYSPSLEAIIVAHEGTDPTQLESDLTDIDVPLATLDSTLFPGISSDVEVHTGFQDEHALTASIILTEVQSLMSSVGTNNIVAVGHSLGGALAEIDTVFFRLNIPSANISAMTYGTPRVGNPAWAALVDASDVNFKRIDNMQDLIPIVPGRTLGYEHPAGEIHILSAGDVVSCPGEDDATDSECQIDSVPTVFQGNIIDHLGPYEGIYIGTVFCT
ncbi:Alpha/Beta hydrolase protein [Lentinula aciculospora]|uniref:Alpha/Beta hydrolase protein n=1 Tax=Lentinula aciculospora TaxID=153920 RepID=A0A9W9AR26_9AGAR|nr:Alpha/Beta hydrolase protein [Lentinula aciculospora]KAJ4488553.1 Alpha/Beta hydrolase protein [Lentinula aciculospora]